MNYKEIKPPMDTPQLIHVEQTKPVRYQVIKSEIENKKFPQINAENSFQDEQKAWSQKTNCQA